MTIYVVYTGESYSYSYYVYDSDGFKKTVEGFKTHIIAVDHANKEYGNDIKIVYK